MYSFFAYLGLKSDRDFLTTSSKQEYGLLKYTGYPKMSDQLILIERQTYKVYEIS